LIPAAGAIALALTSAACGPVPVIGTWLGTEVTQIYASGTYSERYPAISTSGGDTYTKGIRLIVNEGEQLIARLEIYYNTLYADGTTYNYVDGSDGTMERLKKSSYSLRIPGLLDFPLSCTVDDKGSTDKLDCAGGTTGTSPGPEDDQQMEIHFKRD